MDVVALYTRGQMGRCSVHFRLRAIPQFFAIVCGITLTLSTSIVHAENAFVDFDAPATCPSRAEWIQSVLAIDREAQIDLDEGAQRSDRRLVVRMSERNEGDVHGFSGSVTVGDRTRTFDDASCALVAKALALVTTQALARDAEPAAATNGTAKPAPGAALPATPEPKAEAGNVTVSAGALAQLSFLSAPNAILGLGPYGEIGLRRGRAPSLRLSLSLSPASNIPSGDGSLRLQWLTGAADGCPLRLAATDWLDFAPCARLSLGALAVRGVDLPNPRKKSTFWASAGALVRARAHSKFLRFELGAGLLAPFTRREFTLDPSPAVYRAPAVYGVLEAALGVDL